MKRAIEFEADDGKRFATSNECRAHEKSVFIMLLENLSQGQVADAVERKNIKLADAIEFAGKIISEKRRADGGAKRKRKTVSVAAETTKKTAEIDAVKQKQKTEK